MSERKINCAARPVADLLDRDLGERGDFEILAESIVIVCPGCCTTSALALGVSEEINGRKIHRWQLSGTPEAPTLHPSIHHPGCWHGWLKNGQFTSV